MIYGWIGGMAAAVDLGLKWWIEQQDPKDFPRPMKGTKGKVMLYRHHNPGFPFGFLQEHGQVVRTVPLMVTSALAGAYTALEQKKGRKVEKAALALLIGGSASNLYDRYVRRYVVDYFSFQAGPLKKVIFNIGDLCVFLGAAMLLIRSLVPKNGGNSKEIVKSLENTGEQSK